VTTVEILRTGMVTGVGLSAPAACAAIRAGIAGFEETRFMFDGEWLLGCEVPLVEAWRGREKLVRMAVSALGECLEGLGSVRPIDVPLFLGLAEPSRPGRLQGLDDSLIAEIERRLDVRFHPWSRVFSNGRIGGLQALDYTRRVLAERVPLCLVAGVDSCLVSRTLDAYHRGHRLLSAENSDGFIPGEAAAAALVGPEGSGGVLRCTGVGYGLEPAPLGSGEPTRADGMVQAFRAALADAGWDLGRADYRITDVSGEQYGFKEAALAMTRVLRRRKEEFDIWHPADCVGETGAAIVPIMLGVVAAALAKDWAPGPRAIAHVAADTGERGAFLLEASGAAVAERPIEAAA
jgi:3-oxoacyl-[acyl-carrier-protein] synthase-1